MSNLEIRYVYCIIDCSLRKSFGNSGLDGREVYTFPYVDISAVVSDVAVDSKYESNPLDAIDATEANWLKHDGVVRSLMSEYTLLPVKFHSVLKTEYDLNRTLAQIYRECKAELQKFEKKVELGVKIFMDEKNIKQEVGRRAEEIRKLRKNLSRERVLMIKRRVESLPDPVKRVLESVDKTPGGTVSSDEYLLKIYYAKEFHDVLKEVGEEAQANQLLGKDMILNGSFLVSKDEIGAFEKKLAEIKQIYEARGFEILYSGPWAPYSFTKIKYY